MTRAPSVLSVRAYCGGRLFTAKLSVIVHYLPHQLLDHLPADDAILLTRQFCDCLRDGVGGSTDRDAGALDQCDEASDFIPE